MGRHVIGEFERSDTGNKNDAAIQIHVGGRYYNTQLEKMKYASSSGCYTLNGVNAGNQGSIDFIRDLESRQQRLQANRENDEIVINFKEND